MSRPIISPLTPLTSVALDSHSTIISNHPLKALRSYSVSSSLSSSSTSSTYSRAPEDLLDRLAAQSETATFHLWSAGNVRLAGVDLTIPTRDARDLIEAIKFDERFEMVGLVYLDEHEGDDWKITFRRTSISVSPMTLSLSDSE